MTPRNNAVGAALCGGVGPPINTGNVDVQQIGYSLIATELIDDALRGRGVHAENLR